MNSDFQDRATLNGKLWHHPHKDILRPTHRARNLNTKPHKFPRKFPQRTLVFPLPLRLSFQNSPPMTLLNTFVFLMLPFPLLLVTSDSFLNGHLCFPSPLFILFDSAIPEHALSCCPRSRRTCVRSTRRTRFARPSTVLCS